MALKGLIFDFNGTLVWDTPYHNKAFDIFLERHGIFLTDEEKATKIHGKMNRDIMRCVFDRPLTDEEADAFGVEKELIYQDLIAADLHFADGVESLFDALKERNIPFTIATSSDMTNIAFYFRELQLERWFSLQSIVFNDGTFNSKPEPDIFLKAAALLRLQPEETIVFEDSIAGIRAAERANAGKIIIVNSNNDDYTGFTHTIIHHFHEFDPAIQE